MGLSISVVKKSRGRPKGDGTSPNVGLRVPARLLDALDAYIAAQPAPRPSRPEAIRRILEKSLASSKGGGNLGD